MELDRLLRRRIQDFWLKLTRSLAVTGILGALSIFIAVMTHRHITRPLQRLEGVARMVWKTRNYDLRFDYVAEEEIGQLAAAFNDMMAELSQAREREAAERARVVALQSDLARAMRLTSCTGLS